MSSLYAFDEYKNRVMFYTKNDEVHVPMKLADGSIVFYDRGEQYGEYLIVDDELTRVSEGYDDGTFDNQNWRYLICDKNDLNEPSNWAYFSASYITPQTTAFGYGLPNTNIMIEKQGISDYASVFWYHILQKRLSTNLNWFMPSKDELNALYLMKDEIISIGGNRFDSSSAGYWCASTYSTSYVYYINFSTGNWSYSNENNTRSCRLVYRI